MHWKKLLWDNITSRHTLWGVCMHVCKSHRTPKLGVSSVHSNVSQWYVGMLIKCCLAKMAVCLSIGII